jgi:hypothetical protein
MDSDRAEANFFKSDNTCFHVVFYDEKQFIKTFASFYYKHRIIRV